MKATKLVYFRLFRFCFGLEICSKFEIEKFHFYFFSVSVRLNVVFFCSATHLHHLFGHAHSWISLYFLFTVLSTLVFVSMYSDSYSKKMTHNSINSRVEWSVRRFGAVDLFLVFSFTQPLSLSLSLSLSSRSLTYFSKFADSFHFFRLSYFVAQSKLFFLALLIANAYNSIANFNWVFYWKRLSATHTKRMQRVIAVESSLFLSVYRRIHACECVCVCASVYNLLYMYAHMIHVYRLQCVINLTCKR